MLDYLFPRRATAVEANNIHLLFANHLKFCPRNDSAFIHHLPNLCQAQKQPFVISCDAMLHGRSRGETFGLAVAEFSMSNKPIFTWARSVERAHIDILGDAAFLYDVGNLSSMLERFANSSRSRREDIDWQRYRGFLPQPVMQRFCDVFFRGLYPPPSRCLRRRNHSDDAPCIRYFIYQGRTECRNRKMGHAA